MKVLRAALLATVLTGIALFPDVVQACPNCRESMETNRSLAMGYAASIVTLLAIPSALLAFWIPLIVRLNRGRKA